MSEPGRPYYDGLKPFGQRVDVDTARQGLASALARTRERIDELLGPRQWTWIDAPAAKAGSCRTGEDEGGIEFSRQGMARGIPRGCFSELVAIVREEVSPLGFEETVDISTEGTGEVNLFNAGDGGYVGIVLVDDSRTFSMRYTTGCRPVKETTDDDDATSNVFQGDRPFREAVKPVVSGRAAPPLPSSAETLVPSSAETLVPSNAETLVPSNAETLIPSNTETLVPPEDGAATPGLPSNAENPASPSANFASSDSRTRSRFPEEMSRFPQDPAHSAANGQLQRDGGPDTGLEDLMGGHGADETSGSDRANAKIGADLDGSSLSRKEHPAVGNRHDSGSLMGREDGLAARARLDTGSPLNHEDGLAATSRLGSENRAHSVNRLEGEASINGEGESGDEGRVGGEGRMPGGRSLGEETPDRHFGEPRFREPRSGGRGAHSEGNGVLAARAASSGYAPAGTGGTDTLGVGNNSAMGAGAISASGKGRRSAMSRRARRAAALEAARAANPEPQEAAPDRNAQGDMPLEPHARAMSGTGGTGNASAIGAETEVSSENGTVSAMGAQSTSRETSTSASAVEAGAVREPFAPDNSRAPENSRAIDGTLDIETGLSAAVDLGTNPHGVVGSSETDAQGVVDFKTDTHGNFETDAYGNGRFEADAHDAGVFETNARSANRFGNDARGVVSSGVDVSGADGLVADAQRVNSNETGADDVGAYDTGSFKVGTRGTGNFGADSTTEGETRRRARRGRHRAPVESDVAARTDRSQNGRDTHQASEDARRNSGMRVPEETPAQADRRAVIDRPGAAMRRFRPVDDKRDVGGSDAVGYDVEEPSSDELGVGHRSASRDGAIPDEGAVGGPIVGVSPADDTAVIKNNGPAVGAGTIGNAGPNRDAHDRNNDSYTGDIHGDRESNRSEGDAGIGAADAEKNSGPKTGKNWVSRWPMVDE